MAIITPKRYFVVWVIFLTFLFLFITEDTWIPALFLHGKDLNGFGDKDSFVPLDATDSTSRETDTTKNLYVNTHGNDELGSESGGLEHRLPSCIIIGQQKCGTKALLVFLAVHPRIKRNPKKNEYHFFDWFYDKGMEWYKENMPKCLPSDIVIEKSPSYFRSPEAPERVFQMDPDIKLILIVRDPIDRAMSEYLMRLRRSRRPEKFPSFKDMWKNYAKLYDSEFENWLKYFPLNQILIIDGESFVSDPVKELNRVEDFLHIERFFSDNMFVLNEEKGFYCILNNKTGNGKVVETENCLVKNKGTKHPNIPPALLKEMDSYFRPHNEKFYKLAGLRFDWGI